MHTEEETKIALQGPMSFVGIIFSLWI